MPARNITSSPERDTNPDPITGEPGSHPVGTGIGAATGGATGAAIGSVAGPIGTAVGAVIGAVAGGLAGKGIAEVVDPTAEDSYWREQHRDQSFARADRSFDDYAPAYRTGYTGYREGRSFEETETDLRSEYEKGSMQSDPATETMNQESVDRMQHNMNTPPMGWEDAREAARAAYERVRRGEASRKPTANS